MQHNTNPIPNRTLFIHDNLDILRGMNSESVDLIATDPPFNKGRDFHATPDSLAAGARFQDRWSWEADVHEDWVDSIKDDQPALYELIDFVVGGMAYDSRTRRKRGGREDLAAFLCWLGVRVIEMRRVLKPTGALYLHCDPTASHYIKAMLDSVFGVKHFQNEIIWRYRRWPAKQRRFQKMHDVLLLYSKDGKEMGTFNQPYEDLAASTKKTWGTKQQVADFSSGRRKPSQTDNESPGAPMSDVWDIGIIAPISKERMGYPTQKPLALYERIIKASSNEGDIVLDPFCGCATTLVAAENLNRHWIGIDLWEQAAATLQQRIGFPVHARYEPPIRTDDDTDSAVPDLPSINRIQRRVEPWMRLSHADMRAALYGAQAGVCAGCGRQVEVEFMELDHILPRADGGANTIDNRVMLCSPCNRRKSNILTMSGLVRANRAAGWTQDAKRASMAADRARLHADSVKAEGQAAYSPPLV